MENLETPKAKKTILIFGISSFVGSNLAEFLKKDFRIVGTYYRTPIYIPGVMTIPCNVLNKEEVRLVVYASKPDVTLYCVGLSSLMDCSKRADLAEALNTSGLFNVAEYCQRYKSQVCYISSNFVFGGENKSYLEMDIPDANMVYGKTQASAEFYIQKTLLNYIIFRCCRFYGRNIDSQKKNWFETIQYNLAKNASTQLDSSLRVGFLDVYYLALVIKISIEKGVTNRLFQVSSQDTASFYDFSKMYTKVFGESETMLSKTKWTMPFLKGSVHTSVSAELSYQMDVSNLEGFLRLKMPTIEESLQFTFKRFHGLSDGNRSKKKTEGINCS